MPTATATTLERFGLLALAIGQRLPVQVCRSRNGYYLGTLDADGLPCSRESAEYWPKREQADQALTTGRFTQRVEP